MTEMTERRWLLSSTAEGKGACLRRLVDDMPGLTVSIRQQKPKGEIYEKNDSVKSPYLYSDKAYQIWALMKGELLPGEVGIATDTHPKLQDQHTNHFSDPLVKYSGDLKEATGDERKAALSEYIAGKWSPYEGRMIERQGVGVIPWVAGGLLGLITQKLYIHFPDNPLPDIYAARDYLDYCREHYPGNEDLQVNSGAAGAILHPELIAWAAQTRGMEIQIDGVETDSLRELEDTGYGFSRPIVRALAGVTRHTKFLEGSWKGEKKRSQISFWPSRTSKLVWSRDENQVVVSDSWKNRK
jgi:hypothetical protein